MRLKYLCSSFSTSLTQSAVKSEGQYKVFGASGFVGYLDEYAVAAPYLGIVKDGAGVGRVRKYNSYTSLLGTLAYIVPNEKVNIDWLKYVIQSLDLGNDIDKTTIPHIYFSEYGNREINYISLDEQQRIATFLDGECARIDSVIEKTRASIVEYKKLKQAVITRAVTKGIRPAQTMKDSGLEWLGDIPADWDCCKLKYLISSLNSGISVTATDLIDEGYPVYGGGQQIGFFSQFNMEDTIVVGRVGAKCGCVTKVIGKAWATDNALIVTTDFPKDYLYYILVAAELNKLNTSNAQPLITSGKVLNYKVAVPPRAEQKEIAQYLDEKTAAIDLLIEKKNQLATELERLKKSLIFEYVTGKKAVPA